MQTPWRSTGASEDSSPGHTRRQGLLLAVALGLVLSLASAAHAQRELKSIPEPDPELERRSFQVAEGFEVNLYAADPLLAKPIQMNFDAAGRLWVASSEVYPQIKPGQKANDKIIILEDTDGKGRANKTTVFADGLLIPTGVEPGDGGAYVANSTELLHLKDTDGDGKADRQRIVLSGFGTEDTHHILHTFRWGPDGMLYFNQSIYIHSHIETPYGVRRLEAGGVWQFRPETMQLEVFLRGFCNPWGHHFDRWGQSFVTDGAYDEGINYGLPGASYVFAKDATRLLGGLNPGSPKHCGLEILSGHHLPEAWRGNAITNDFRGHRVCRFVLSEDGAGYASQEKPELIKTDHAAFRPIDVKMGPDGAIYIADWYNPIIQHGEVDFRDPRRDHTHGRIWRVTAKGRPLVKRPQLVGAPTEQLLEALKAPEDWTRHFAKRVLKERGPSVLPVLAAWVDKLDPKDPVCEHHLLEALWTYQSLDTVAPKLLDRLLHARDHRARAAATRVVQYWHARLTNPMALLTERIADEHPQVCLEAVRALGKIPNAQAAQVALRALDRHADKFLDYGLWLTMRELAPYWVPALQKGQIHFGAEVGPLLFALKAVSSPATVQTLVGLVNAARLSPDQKHQVLAMVADLGGAKELALVFDQVLVAEGPARQADLLAKLEHAMRQRGVRPAGDLGRLGQLLGSENENSRTTAARLAGLWQVESLRPRLEAFVQSSKSDEAVVQAAIDGLAALGGPASQKTFERWSGPDRPLVLRRKAVIAMTALEVQSAARLAVALLSADFGGTDPAPIFAAFLQRKNGAEALTAALAKQRLPAEMAKIGTRVVRAGGRDQPELLAVLTKAGGLTAGPRVLSPADMEQVLKAVAQHGDPARGELIYRRKELTCMKCHAIGGAGGQVGPDLASIGASAPVDYLVDSLLQPNKAVKENYHSLVVATKSGRLFTGIKTRETESELVLRDAEDREIAVPVKDIEEKTVGGSLMPEGLTDGLTRAEFVDLVRFLAELGKVGPYSVSKRPLVRRWQVLEPTRDAYHLLARIRFASVTSNSSALTWSPAYSTVAGVLPLDALAPFHKRTASEDYHVGFVRCETETSARGKVKIRLNSPLGLTAWMDGEPFEAKEETQLELKPGMHTLTLAVNLSQRHDALRCEWDEVPGFATRVRIISGK
jgi:putative heme-binding domain-containing protein